MKTFRTPNFLGQKALILHRGDENIRRLQRQLDRLGISSTVSWPDYDLKNTTADLVLFDGDNAYDDLFPWTKGLPPVPLIALISSEAPGRLEWMLSQSISAHLVKPVQSSGLFSTLVIAYANFERSKELEQQIGELESRISRRPVIFKALLLVMEHGEVDEEAAYGIIRTAAMNSRVSIEDFCQTVNRQVALSLIEKHLSGKGAAS
ncbi:ANTAR domain-containing response regulator [Kiloniella laminariae]|uniref:ANTAR domain-containing response regulator n=1 Tax=Kiloniella laminariae TaxID=454162 RepID=UPI000375BA13|nr:ANTAR domain-containing protein [Kiloniella laminariae]